MKINYLTEKQPSKYLYLDVPYRQATQHIGLAVVGGKLGLSIIECISHLALGILKLIPVLGHLVVAIDTLLHAKTITHVRLQSTAPFERGKEHGQRLKKQIREIYTPILAQKGQNQALRQAATAFENNIPDALLEEMKGLAAGSGYRYEDVLLIHTFLDAAPGQYGCSAMARLTKGDGTDARIAAANHSLANSPPPIGESEKRRTALLNASIVGDTQSTDALKESGVKDTIQSILFDTETGDIHLSASGSYASHKKFTNFQGSELFEGKFPVRSEQTKSHVQLFRHLDWPWYFLGQNTVLLARKDQQNKTTVSVSFPGYIGTLSGMNSSGLALSVCQNGWQSDKAGVPNPLLFTHMLDTCQSVDQATSLLGRKRHGSSMNIVLADRAGAKSLELQGNGNVIEAGSLT